MASVSFLEQHLFVPGAVVGLYLPEEEEQGELDTVTAEVEELPDELGFNEPVVQPAPDDRRELEFVAHAIKRLVHDTGVKPHEIAVVARHGREDTRRAHEVLSWAGVPTTARVRSSFAEVPALKAILHLFRAAAHKWTYRPLRHVLESAYFDLDIDLRSIDHLARGRRIDDLGTWLAELSWLRHSVEEMEGTGKAARDGVFGDRVARDVAVRVTNGRLMERQWCALER